MIKLFEQFNNEQEIHDICKKYNIENYTINPDGSIDVDGNVNITYENLLEIPINFNNVSGDFYCQYNSLTTLKGSPKYVGGSFFCNNNELTTLEHSPIFIKNIINYSSNMLTSMIGCSKHIGSMILCDDNYLVNLDYIPKHINDDLDCSRNKITTFKNGPMCIDGRLYINNNPISLIDSSLIVNFDIDINNTKFYDKIKNLSQDKLRILFEHGIDYDIFRKDGSINDSRLERMFKDFNL